MIYTKAILTKSVAYARNALIIQGNESVSDLTHELRDRNLKTNEKIGIMYMPQERYTQPISDEPVEKMLSGWSGDIHTRWLAITDAIDQMGYDVDFIAFDIEGKGSAQYWVWGESKILEAYDQGVEGLPDIDYEIMRNGTNQEKKAVIFEWQTWAAQLLKDRMLEYLVKPVIEKWGPDVGVSNYEWSEGVVRKSKGDHEIPQLTLNGISSPVLYSYPVKPDLAENETHPWVRPWSYWRVRVPNALIFSNATHIDPTQHIPEPL